jgi:phage major head subunit gpT-like protein
MFTQGTQSLAASKNFTGVFYTELENNPAPSWIALVFQFIFSSVRTEILAFTKGFPQMTEWLGERRVQSLSEYSVTVSKKDWELTVGVGRDDIFFDKIGIVADQIRGIAQAVPRHFVKFFTDLCLNGFATTCYDGSNFFDTNHPNGATAPTTFSNTSANAFSATEWETANTNAAKIKNTDSGNPLVVRWTHIFYAPNAWAAVNKFFKQDRLANGETNIYQNVIAEPNRIQVQEFGNTAKWFLFDLGKLLKPFALMIVKGIDFVLFDKPTDWVVFSKKEYVAGIDTMDNATYVLPELGYGSSTA